MCANQVSWLNRLQADYANLRAALEWCLETPGHEINALEFASALPWFWSKRGYLSEGRQWLERALEAESGASVRLRGKAWNGVGHMSVFQSDCDAGRLALEKSLHLALEAGDQVSVAWSLGLQAEIALLSGDVARIPTLATECQAAAIASGEPWLQCPGLECLAYKVMSEGDYDRARQLIEEQLDLGRRKGDKWIASAWPIPLRASRERTRRKAAPRAPCDCGERWRGCSTALARPCSTRCR